MGKCKDCRSWKPQKTPTSLQQAGPIKGECDHLSDMSNVGEDGFDIGWDVLDDSGLNIWLETGPEFGCVRFRPKEKEEEIR